MNKTKIAIIDRHDLVREGLTLMLREYSDLEIVGDWRNSEDALPHLANNAANVIILDAPGHGGECLKALARLKQVASQVRIIVLTNSSNLSELTLVFKSGASGYISKHTATATFLDAIREVNKGKAFVEQEMKEQLVSNYLNIGHVGELKTATQLTNREQQVLLLLAQGTKPKDAASQLGLSPKTVETHKYRLMHKLSLSNQSDIVRYAANQGWLQPGLRESQDPAIWNGLNLAKS